MVVDSRSTDGTAAIAAAHGARVVKCGVLDGPAGWRFAALKRRSFEDIRLEILEADARDRRS